MDAKLKHLEFIQEVINRLASASFQMKGWSVVLVSALLVLLAGSSPPGDAARFVVFVPVGMFWVLDGYFLWQERRFRQAYDHVRKLEPKDVDFSMAVPVGKGTGPFGLVRRWGRAAFSFILLVFHGGLAVLALVAALYLGGDG